MRSAVRHVIQTSDQFSQIAYNLGYGHAGQFSHDFGEYFGLSPRQLRCVSSGLRYLR
jgi:transcriptional regulator GlxA family with amidase domain